MNDKYEITDVVSCQAFYGDGTPIGKTIPIKTAPLSNSSLSYNPRTIISGKEYDYYTEIRDGKLWVIIPNFYPDGSNEEFEISYPGVEYDEKQSNFILEKTSKKVCE